MRCSKADLPATFEVPQGTWREVECGGMFMEFVSFQQEVDPGPLLTGLPNDLCPCPHWGYVLQGQLRVTFVDHEEVYNAGDVFYVAPGHRPVIGAHTEFVEFSPAEPYRHMMEVVKHNVAVLRQQAER
jgi:cupin